jgi:hypothetical protein
MLAPEQDEAKHLLLTAFENCRLFGLVYTDNAKNMPIDVSRIRTTVVMRHGIASDQADRFVDVFIRSAVYAGIAESDGKSVRLLPREVVFAGGQSVADEVDDEIEPVEVSAPVISGVGNPAPNPMTHPNVNMPVPIAVRQVWDIDGGEIEFVIRTPKALPPDVYALMADVAVTARKMAEHLSSPYSGLRPARAEVFVGDPLENKAEH